MEIQNTKPSFKEELQRLLPARGTLVAWAVLAVAFWFFHLGSFRRLFFLWSSQEDYQHCFVVPLFSLYLLWVRREMIVSFAGRGSLWSLPMFAIWALMQWVAAYYNYGTLPELSILFFAAGVALLVGGWQGLRWAWPAILFLGFAIPLPGAFQDAARDVLQKIATRSSVYVIQTFGIAAVAQGNIIQLTDKPLEVARACSGLRMMMLFFAICVGAAFLMRKPLWERLLIVASAVPIAVMSNVVRIVATAVLYKIAEQYPSMIDLEAQAEAIHNWAGFAMMPVGLLLLLAETTLLSKLLIEPLDRPLMIGRGIGRDREGAGGVAISEQTLRRRR